MAAPLLQPQGPAYVPLHRASDVRGVLDDYMNPFGLSPNGSPLYRTHQSWSAAPSSGNASPTPRAENGARRVSIATKFAEDDDESIAATTEDDGLSEEEIHSEWAYNISQSDWFQNLVAVAILGSTFAIACETDNPTLGIWEPLNNLFIIFFTVEITLKLLVYHGSFFCSEDWGWNWFDFSLVLFSWIDQVVLDCFFDLKGGGLSDYLTLLRMVRILRILRVLRLFRQCDQLMLLATGLMESMQMVIWIMLLMFMFMLIFAIFLTDMVGNQAYKFENPSIIQDYFGGVIKTLITLFQFLTMDNWSEITREVTNTLPWMRIFFVTYMGIAAFAMLSLLTGVIVDHMTEVSAKQQETGEAEKEEELKLFVSKVEEYLPLGQKDYQGITKEDFVKIMDDHNLLDFFCGFGINLVGHEINEFFELLDRDGDGWITMSEFKIGILRLREEKPKAKDVLRIRYAAERVARHLEGGEGEAITMRKLAEVNEYMASVDNRLAKIKRQLRGFMEFARANHGRRQSAMVSLFSLGGAT
uniref:EF-hand domain-containing protein n=1 Tax=Alexandrium catenella TaxID=2925 RepID=A0A7S1W5M3_ALECA|mmetsp:Transcript_40014/g.108078  ORF Transcript_40014/g.108078 Transcript_40014/m.108078 type:complete len:528 (+) Transcript_40014:89-1672(+)